MTITIYPDKIQFDKYSLDITPTGLRVAGTFSSASTQVLFQGTTAGYSSGGYYHPPATLRNTIDKFPFASDANATDVGDLNDNQQGKAGQSSTTNGYSSGGKFTSPMSNWIEKFPFASNANATLPGTLTVARGWAAGQSSSTHGYTSGGMTTISSWTNIIDRFPFSSTETATDVGDISQNRAYSAGQSSLDDGYTSGGYIAPPSPLITNTIDKFPFASNTNATDVGDLTNTRRWVAGQSSTTHGYTTGGQTTQPSIIRSDIIDKFPFASNANATNVGTLSLTRRAGGGQSSLVSGYTSGGYGPINPPVITVNTIDKFPFATDANATNVGGLTTRSYTVAGHQD